MHGLLLIDKPRGLSSFDVVRRVRRVFGTRKVGHAGTLDPLATGVMAVALGEGTKLLQFLLAENKSYRATLHFGVTTTTLDAEGQELERRPLPSHLLEKLMHLLPDFRGEIEQIPPMYSALKRDGVPLYKLARAGKTVERQSRLVRIDQLDVVDFALPQLTVEVSCSKGTYVRTLGADIGEALGCGAHLVALRRLSLGAFSLDQCLPLDEITDAGQVRLSRAFIPLDQMLSNYPAVYLAPAAARRLRHGVAPGVCDLDSAEGLSEGQTVRLMADEKLLAMAVYTPAAHGSKPGDFELLRVLNPPA
jgi:tRNA pseudouridine55 synthase